MKTAKALWRYFVLGALGTTVAFASGCGDFDELGKVYKLTGTSLSDPALGKVRSRISRVCPPSATDIRVELHVGELLGGSSTVVKCVVAPDEMRKFITESGEMWHFDSTVSNARKGGPDISALQDFYHDDVWRREWEAARQSDEYWSYYEVYPNNGGTRWVYFVKTKTMFYDWSSN